MPERTSMLSTDTPARINLKAYSAELSLRSLAVGVDNIHHDVFLSPAFVESTEAYLLEFIRQTVNLPFLTQKDRSTTDRRATPRREADKKNVRPADAVSWKKQLSDLLHSGLQKAKFEKNIEIDLILRATLLKYLTQEIGAQFANILLEAKEWIRGRGEHFDRSEQAHVIKANLAELQADRRNLFRKVGQHVYQAILDIEDNSLGRSRKALFGEEAATSYDILNNRLAFVENGKDDVMFLEQYVLLGNYIRDQDRFETFDAVFLDLLRESVATGDSGSDLNETWHTHQKLVDSAVAYQAEIARLKEERETLMRKLERSESLMGRVGFGADPASIRAAIVDIEKRQRYARRKLEETNPRIEVSQSEADYQAKKYQDQLGDFLNQPENARRLFDPGAPGTANRGKAGLRAQLLEELVARLEQRDLLVHILASYQLRNICHDYCPPIHLQQLKKALVSREELKRVEEILKQFPARQYSAARIEELSKKIRKTPREEVRTMVVRFAEDFMRLRRDTRNYERLSAAMERINLVRNERRRELSELNHSLYEFLLPEEARPAEDHVVTHTIIKADVRGSTKITQDLLARGLNPASLFSLNFYEPVKRILDRYGASKVFIEGDALVLAIYETESTRANQRAVSKACALARQILAVSTAYNEKPDTAELPRLELGLGIAFQGSAPTYWMDTDSRIMISRALNLSDRLSSCSKAAKRMLAENSSPFRLFLFQTMMEDVAEDEADEFLVRFNLNGVELNEEGFQKLREEISLTELEADCIMPWGKERVTFFRGETPVGEGLEPVLIRRGFIREMLPGGKIGQAGTRPYYEVCVSPKVLALADLLAESAEERREKLAG
jgi:class 3 adenylate cyclase